MLTGLRIWILLSALLVFSGWFLSALGELNRIGYAIVLGLAAGALFFWLSKRKPRKTPASLFQKWKRRFRRLAPLLFLVLALLSLAAGALHVSVNSDSNGYRIPRVWHWLAEGRWHWIRTMDFRMNTAACNFEWLGAPWMLFTRYDRWLFLANWVSYLFLPGLVFSVFTRLQVPRRVAWWWMWILSSGFCYAMQAGSDVNDSFAVIYALASLDFALRAREKGNIHDFWFSILSVALLTGAKQTDILLVLPWLIAAVPCLRLIKIQPLATFGIILLAIPLSVLPLACLNYVHIGNWAGMPPPSSFWKVSWPPPFWCFVGNLFCIPVQNLIPPYFPFTDKWNDAMSHFVQTPFGSHFREFENFGFIAGRGVSEQNAGIGLWIVMITIISISAAVFFRRVEGTRKNGAFNPWIWLLIGAPFLSLVVFMGKVATFENARQLAAYYVFFFPAILISKGHGKLVRQTWWQSMAIIAMLLTAVMLIIARNRPLFPAQTVLSWLHEKHPQSHFISKVQDSFSFTRSIENGRNAFQNTIPPQEHIIGYATVRGAQEAGQWVPFGRRRVERVLSGDKPSDLQAQGIHFVMVDSDGLGLLNWTITDWTNRFNGTIVDSIDIQTSAGSAVTNYLVHLNPPLITEPRP